MPNIWTHIMFCEEIMDSTGAQEEFSSVQPYLNLGAQGPDPFFYHNFWPWKKDHSVNEVGNVMHHQECGPLLLDMIKSAKHKSLATRGYVAGFVTHHILDRNTHPYIHYLAGYEKNKHQVLEVAIDTVMMSRYRNFETWKTPVYKEIDVGAHLDEEIQQLLHQLLLDYFPDTIQSVPDHYINQAYKDMKLALTILFDPQGWKNKLLGTLVSPFSHQPIRDEKDYLNDKRETWYHSATNEASKKSFVDLFEEARIEGIDLLTEVRAYWKDKEESRTSQLEAIIQNISYDTGKPLELKVENQYSNPIV